MRSTIDVTTRRQIGNMLREKRHSLNKSQEAMGLDLYQRGISEETYKRVERGDTRVSVSTLIRVCDAAGVNLADYIPTDSNAAVLSQLASNFRKQTDECIEIIARWLLKWQPEMDPKTARLAAKDLLSEMLNR